MTPLANHLWQSTLFALGAALLALALRNSRAQVRYGIWLAASLKFLVPFSLLISLASQTPRNVAPKIAAPVSAVVEQISHPFASEPAYLARNDNTPTQPIVPVLIWLGGCCVILCLWFARWRKVQRAARSGRRIFAPTAIPIISTNSTLEPGVFGIVKPVLLLPAGIGERLSPQQLNTILAHELCHVRRRDNLASAIHMFVQAAFWFHPLVWWIGKRLIDERERACDEDVIRAGNDPETYASGILDVCKFYLESPLACAAGVTGADLKKRIEAIMTHHVASRLTVTRKTLLVAAGAAALSAPIIVGVVRAQGATFAVASVKRADPNTQRVAIMTVPGGGMDIVNVSLKQLICAAYSVRPDQVSGGPNWLDSEKYSIQAKPDKPTDISGIGPNNHEKFHAMQMGRLRALLEDRFHLQVRKESRDASVYALVVAKNGPKLKAADHDNSRMGGGRGSFNGFGVTMEMLAGSLGNITGRKVIDKTGITGRFDLTLEWSPELGGSANPLDSGTATEAPSTATGPSLFTALQEQLGLKLESQRGSAEQFVVVRAERPTEN